ncbi:MAG: 50S ribosomal protein L9 [Myxococcales bacterium]|nr:50S ribosomal protein L9 [Myxococcales bacterium]
MPRNLQVILSEDLSNVGASGELVKVKPGYARNFLLPRGLASMASKENVRRVEHEKRVAVARTQKQRAEAQAVAQKLAGVKVSIQAQVGEGSKLYGSITSRDVEQALALLGHVVDRRKIIMDAIKELGTHQVPIKIAAGVDATVEVEVVPRA